MQNKTVLIVEDSAFDQQMLIAMVGKLGFRHLLCADGQEALLLLKDCHKSVDLVLLDLILPGIDGISIIGHLKAHYPQLPIIVVSSVTDKDEIAHTLKVGADDFISKPVEFARFAATVRKILNVASGEYSRVAKQ